MAKFEVPIWNLKQKRGKQIFAACISEQGVSMLSAVLNSTKAVNMSIAIIRIFILLRQYTFNFAELKQQIKKMESKTNIKFRDVYKALDYLLEKDKIELAQKERIKIGYKRLDN